MVLEGLPPPVGVVAAYLALELLPKPVQLVEPKRDGLAIPPQRQVERVVHGLLLLFVAWHVVDVDLLVGPYRLENLQRETLRYFELLAGARLPLFDELDGFLDGARHELLVVLNHVLQVGQILVVLPARLRMLLQLLRCLFREVFHNLLVLLPVLERLEYAARREKAVHWFEVELHLFRVVLPVNRSVRDPLCLKSVCERRLEGVRGGQRVLPLEEPHEVFQKLLEVLGVLLHSVLAVSGYFGKLVKLVEIGDVINLAKGYHMCLQLLLFPDAFSIQPQNLLLLVMLHPEVPQLLKVDKSPVVFLQVHTFSVVFVRRKLQVDVDLRHGVLQYVIHRPRFHRRIETLISLVVVFYAL
ncbi:DUF4445 domain-containing protein [Babesia caballi]|uniref:DUF4445 domain-containing protein n=1 Tax=Babesia caballi TaxID=5871 RepID=A0AAV4LVM8_BABCB|nr:DUF4445 domain-containing protein [Babesia caballi]